MFQDFDVVAEPSVGAPRVALLRGELRRHKLDGYLVPLADEHQGEYLPACARRLKWLTGFSGSAGCAVVLTKVAGLFVDGRYVEQAKTQVDTGVFVVRQVPNERISTFIAAAAKSGARIGFDARLFTVDEVANLAKALQSHSIELIAVDANLVDAVWTDRPPPPIGEVSLQPIEFTGRSADEKIAELKSTLKAAGEDAVVLTQPDSIAWLLNIRGSDLPHTPFALAFAIVGVDGKPRLFIDARKLADVAVRKAVEKLARIEPPDALAAALDALGRARSKVRLDPASAAEWMRARVADAGAEVSRAADPCFITKCKKTTAELDGARAAHRRDGAALSRFLAWFDREAPKGRLDEIAAAEQLERFRQQTNELLDLSFDSISAAGPHAALPHYHPNRESNARIKPGSIYLIDSGGQYRDGTTDVTRTIAVGKPPKEICERATLVLKGMIAVSLLRFPAGTTGAHIDAFARQALWNVGLDYDHGTGHGVGSYLSVHEGPQRISRSGHTVLEPGMIISNEPGYYKPGGYGIRIETLVVVGQPEVPKGGERAMMGFETLTLAPIDRRLIVTTLMTTEEIGWLDRYHARVRKEIGPQLTGDDKGWLVEATKPLAV